MKHTVLDSYLAAVKGRADLGRNLLHMNEELRLLQDREVSLAVDEVIWDDVPALLEIIAGCREEMRKAEAVLDDEAGLIADEAKYVAFLRRRQIGYRGWDAIAEKWEKRREQD